MKFQNLKRIICCLMAVMILCCTVVQPLEAQATAVAATAVEVVAQNLVASALRSFGINVHNVLEANEFEALCNRIVLALPERFRVGVYLGNATVRMVLQNGITYAPRGLLEWIYEYLVTPQREGQTADVSYSWSVGMEWAMPYVANAFADYEFTYEEFDYAFSHNIVRSGLGGALFWFSNHPAALKVSIVTNANGVQGLEYSSPNPGFLILITPSSGGYNYTCFIHNTTEKQFITGISSVALTSYSPFDDLSLDESLVADPDLLGLSFNGSAYLATAEPIEWPSDTSGVDDDEGYPISVPVDVSGAFTSPWADIVSGANTATDSIVDSNSSVATPDLTGITGLLSQIISILKSLALAICQPIVNAITGVQTVVKAIGATLTDVFEWLKNIGQVITDAIISALTAVFVPSADYLTAKVEVLCSNFTFADSIVRTAKFLNSGLSGVSTEPPVIYIHLEAQEGFYDIGGTVPFLDLRWYARYKPTVDILISAFLWICFVWRMLLKLPGIISGMPGDFVMAGVHELGLDNHLPSRKAAYEVQRQSNRELIRKGRSE